MCWSASRRCVAARGTNFRSVFAHFVGCRIKRMKTCVIRRPSVALHEAVLDGPLERVAQHQAQLLRVLVVVLVLGVHGQVAE